MRTIKIAGKICASALLLILVFSACTPARYTKEYYDLFDTYTKVVSYGMPVPNAIYAELKYYHDLFNVYSPDFDSDAPKVQELVKLCEKYTSDSGGVFDVKLGAFTLMWKQFIAAERPLPAEQEILEIKLSSVQPLYDFGAVAKGYVLDKLDPVLEELGFSGTVSIGGSVRAYGNPKIKRTYAIGITDPGGGIWKTIEIMPGQSVATSGNYERYRDYEGIRYHHIIDPRTGYPAQSGVNGVTVVCDSAADADFLSTAEFIKPSDSLLEIYNAEAYWIYEE
ncbi:MAG: FAD:protein FMN transferase [Oscillospiraceae bacterium]|jgi:thiamine biosynthesis lipoprotein ApbE|nr:FAD:protein FMN transferase [Oscillospiraceae bacterium]